MYKYIYSNNSKTLHDENCKYASSISEEHIKSSASWFFFRSREMSFCKCCGYHAEMLAVAQTTYSDYETNKVRIPIDLLIKLAKYYDVSLDFIAGLTKNKGKFPIDFGSTN